MKDLIDLRIKQIQSERGEEFTPIDEVETRKIKVTKKYQTIFEIPLPTKDPELVEEVIKVLIGHIESKMNTKVDGLHSLKGQAKIFEDYDELNRRLQQWYIEHSQKRTTSEGTSESSTKKPRVNIFKVGCSTREQQKIVYDIEETIKDIENRGKVLKDRKDQQIWSIDED